ncbi:MAG: signal peptidase II [Lachnospiraceae bacterium]|nr:signal peptidase II [Lachnospiraceae bacterium]
MKKLIYFLALIFLIAIDQVVKALTVLYIDPKNPIVLWNGVFELDYVQNRGGLFGMFQGAVLILAAVTVVLIVLIFYFSKKLPDTKRMMPLRIIGLLIIAGGIGNLIDRIFRGFVVDTFSFVLINFPVFNVADCYVTVSMFIFIFLFLFYYKDEEFDCLFPRKKTSKAVDTEITDASEEGDLTKDTEKGENIG